MSRESDYVDHLYETVAMMVATFHGRRLVTRKEYREALQVAEKLYRENTMLREALADLERLASSWTISPERSAAIVQARKALATTPR